MSKRTDAPKGSMSFLDCPKAGHKKALAVCMFGCPFGKYRNKCLSWLRTTRSAKQAANQYLMERHDMLTWPEGKAPRRKQKRKGKEVKGPEEVLVIFPDESTEIHNRGEFEGVRAMLDPDIIVRELGPVIEYPTPTLQEKGQPDELLQPTDADPSVQKCESAGSTEKTGKDGANKGPSTKKGKGRKRKKKPEPKQEVEAAAAPTPPTSESEGGEKEASTKPKPKKKKAASPKTPEAPKEPEAPKPAFQWESI